MTIPPNPHPEQVEAEARIWLRAELATFNKRGDHAMQRVVEHCLASLANRPADDGERIVPLDPTVEMIEAGRRPERGDALGNPGMCYLVSEVERIYRAMVAVAPQPTSERPADDGGLEQLREALEPFARYADGIGHFTGPQGMFDWSFESHEIGKRKLTEADFARASAALPPQPEGVKRP